MLKITRLWAKSTDGSMSEIPFTDGLNIIHGPSNTGKTVIVDCIDYIFGGKFTPNPTLNLEVVGMDMDANGHHYHLSRAFNSPNVHVESDDDNIKDGDYSSQKKPSLGDIYLRMLGMEPPIKILSSLSYTFQNLTFREFSHTIVLKEDDIRDRKSILMPTQKTSETVLKSAVLYLINGLTYADPNIESPKERAKRKKILAKYINERIGKYKTLIEQYEKDKKEGSDQFKTSIDDILGQIESTQGQLNDNIAASGKLSGELMEISDKIAECENLGDKYTILHSQYESDLRRMQLIIDGETHADEVEKITKCPFCNGELPKEQEQSCVEAAQAELLKLIPQIKDLEDAQGDLVKEKEELQAKKAELEGKINELEAKINSEIKPLLAKLRNQLNLYKESIHSEAEYESDKKILADLESQLRELTEEKVENERFNQLECFDDRFINTITRYLREALAASNYEGAETCIFDINQFDVRVNGQMKQHEGEGYRGLLNSITAVAFHKMLLDNAKYKPGLLIMDSPILSLKEADSIPLDDSMKKGLFNYLVQTAENMQIIVVENELPEFDSEKANLIHFTKDDNGRYGFISNVR